MKKTLTVNISGTVFHIEEDAYERLHHYLGDIRRQFEGGSGCEEIMADIEARIAELFTERLDGRGEVVTMAEVDHVVAVMGRPEDYAGTEEHQAPPSGSGGKRYRKLFRDPDDRWIGGVLGGLAAYIGADPLWLRIPFIILVVLGAGSPILAYLIMWLLVPLASTTAERLMMEGEPVTVDNLKRAFEEGGKRVAREVEELGERWGSAHGERTAGAMRRSAGRAADTTARVLAVIVGAVIFLVGMGLFIPILVAALGGGIFLVDEMGTGINEVCQLIFPTAELATWSIVAAFLLLLVPIIGLLTGGLRLMLGLPAPRWMGWILGPLWVASLIAIVIIGVLVGRDFRRNEPLSMTIPLEQPTGRILYLTGLPASDDAHPPLEREHGPLDRYFTSLHIAGDSVHVGRARVDVRRSTDEDYHLRVERESQGATLKASLHRSANITYTAVQQDSVLGLSAWYSFPKEDKVRGQRLRFVILVPMGGSVHLGQEMAAMLSDVKNVTNTLDHDMVGRTWTMTPDGLKAVATFEDTPADDSH